MIYKALVHGGFFIDSTRLRKGLYQVSIPKLHDREETIDTLISRYKMMSEGLPGGYPIEDIIANLRKCELVEVRIDVI